MSCLLCGNDTVQTGLVLFDTRFGIERAFGIDKCRQCGAEATSPVPSDSELSDLYARYYNFGGETGTRYTGLRSRLFSSFFYKLWLRIDGDISFHGRKGEGRLLDIGCNEGRGLSFYSKNGFVAEGLETNEPAALAARGAGFTVYTETVAGMRTGQPYDVAVLSNVLEHSTSPRDMLADVHRLLRPGAELWISCPNAKSWQRSLFGDRWINWHVPFHISHFTVGTLKSALDFSGFELIEARQKSPSLWLAHSIIARLFARKGRALTGLRNPMLVASLMLVCRGLLFPLIWIGNLSGRGDCLVVRARKCAS